MMSKQRKELKKNILPMQQDIKRRTQYPGIPTGGVINFEPISWAYFKRGGDLWFWDPTLANGGGYFDIQG